MNTIHEAHEAVLSETTEEAELHQPAADRLSQLLRDQRGLTLVEVMVTISIIALLATVVGMNVIGSLEDARVDTTISQVRNIEGALTRFRITYGRYPTTSEGIAALVTPPARSNGPTPSPIMLELPTDAWENPFLYRSPGSGGQDYEIVSLGKDGVEGGTGPAGDLSSANL
jgi:general secretion pathway protein G